MNPTPFLSWIDLAAASLLVLLNAGLSLALDLRIGRSLLLAAVRTVVQLLLVGLVLKVVFALESPWLVGLVLLAMMLAASREVLSRQKRRIAGPAGWGIGAGTMVLATALATLLSLSTLQPDPWYAPHVVIPLVGIVLGNVMNGVSISLNAFNGGIVAGRAAIEARLALGATRQQALQPLQRDALRNALIPVINQMAAAGIITLPGMMTGQIIAGMPPYEAAKFQIFVLFLLAGAAGLGAIAALWLAARQVTDTRDRLRLDRLAPPRG